MTRGVYTLRAILMCSLFLSIAKMASGQDPISPEALELEKSLLEKFATQPVVNSQILQAANTLSNQFNHSGFHNRTIPLLSTIAAQPKPTDSALLSQYETSLYLLGLALLETGRISEAIPLFQRSLAIIDSQGQSGSMSFAASNMNLGISYMRLGQFDQSIRYYDIAVEACKTAIEDRQLSPGHPFYIELLAAAGGTYYSKGDYENAKTLLLEARQLHETSIGKPTPTYPNILTNLANLHQRLGDHKQATDLYSRAYEMNLKFFGSLNRATIMSLSNLASSYRNNKDISLAIEKFEEALQLTEQFFGDNHSNVATVQSNLAMVYYQAKEFENALRLLQSAQSIHDNSRRETSNFPEVAINLFNIAQTYNELTQTDRAIDFYEEALLIHRLSNGDNHHIEAIILINLASLYMNTGETDMAIFTGKKAANAIQTVRADLADQDQGMRAQFLASIYPALEYLSYMLIESGRLSEVSIVSRMKREEEYSNFNANSQQNARRTKIPLNRIERELEKLYENYLHRLEAIAINTQTNKRNPKFSSAMLKLRAAFLRDLKAWKARHPKITADSAINDRDAWPTILASQASHSAVYQAILSDDGVFALLSTSSGTERLDISVGTGQLNRLIFDLLQAFRNPRSDPKLPAGQLYDTIIAPAETILQREKIDTIYLQLDKSLRYLPIAALYDVKSKSYLIEKYAIANLSESSPPEDLDVSKPRRVSGFGTQSAHHGFAPLPFVGLELDEIIKESVQDKSGAFPGEVWMDTAFNKQQVLRTTAEDFSILHFASHFSLNPGSMNDSYLLLGDGDRLPLSEIATLDLKRAELIVLSACETAVGNFSDRQGLGSENEGMATLLQERGAEAVVASYWPISDKGAAIFMSLFYEQLAKGLSYSNAIQSAQVAMLDNIKNDKIQLIASRGKFGEFSKHNIVSKPFDLSHPYYWAPFVVYQNLSK